MQSSSGLAAKGRESAAQGASPGSKVGEEQAPKGRKSSFHTNASVPEITDETGLAEALLQFIQAFGERCHTRSLGCQLVRELTDLRRSELAACHGRDNLMSHLQVQI